TIIYGILDCGLGTFTYATAGHCGPLHISAQGSCNALPTAHPAIGLSPETLYTQQSLDLAAGDTLYFYTDGIVEAQNPAKEEYSLERMQEVLGRARIQGKSDLDTALSALLGDVSRWNRNEYKDDVTILALARTE
ncbi:MAG: serine/threonine-protein phosphatase, partial [Desulfovibrio sp.]